MFYACLLLKHCILLLSQKGSESFNPLHCFISGVLTLHFEESTGAQMAGIFSVYCAFLASIYKVRKAEHAGL